MSKKWKNATRQTSSEQKEDTRGATVKTVFIDECTSIDELGLAPEAEPFSRLSEAEQRKLNYLQGKEQLDSIQQFELRKLIEKRDGVHVQKTL